LLACTTLAVLALAGLLVAATQPIARRTFLLDAPNATLLAVLRPSSHVCEGPIVSQSPTQSVGFWGMAGPGQRAQLTVGIQDAATHKLLASVPVAAPPVEAQVRARLRRPLPAGLPLTICLTQDAGTLSLYGSGAENPRIVMTSKLIGPQPTNGRDQEFSLDLFENHSLLDSVGLAFSRAALWRPSWVGTWTFWVLAVALLGAFGLGVAATVTAASADEDEGPGRGVRDADDSPPPPQDQSGESSSPRVALR
jgi:hypothetical protein